MYQHHQTVILIRHRAILNKAKEYLQKDEPEMSVVLAQAACEIRIKRLFVTLLNQRKLGFLIELDWGIFTRGFNISKNRKVQRFYVELTGDAIKQTPFWEPLVNLAELRHRIVHDGATCTRAEVELLLEYVQQFFTHLDSIQTRTMQDYQKTRLEGT